MPSNMLFVRVDCTVFQLGNNKDIVFTCSILIYSRRTHCAKKINKHSNFVPIYEAKINPYLVMAARSGCSAHFFVEKFKKSYSCWCSIYLQFLWQHLKDVVFHPFHLYKVKKYLLSFYSWFTIMVVLPFFFVYFLAIFAICGTFSRRIQFWYKHHSDAHLRVSITLD